jgi:hypothetical protein
MSKRSKKKNWVKSTMIPVDHLGGTKGQNALIMHGKDMAHIVLTSFLTEGRDESIHGREGLA